MDEHPEDPVDPVNPEDTELAELIEQPKVSKARNRKRKWNDLTRGGTRTRLFRERKKNMKQMIQMVPLDVPIGDPINFPLDVSIDVPLDVSIDVLIEPDVALEVPAALEGQGISLDGLFVPNRDPVVTEYLKRELNAIATRYSVTLPVVNSYLHLFQRFFPNLPSDGRTLRSTPRTIKTRQVEPGLYVHQGVGVFMRLLIRQLPLVQNVIEMDVFVDGVAFHKIGRKNNYWVILGRFAPSKKVFCVGVYNGTNQPKSFNDLLKDFIDECLTLRDDGITVDGKVYHLKMRNFIADSIAQSDIAYIKGPAGHNSCPYCKVQGVRYMNRTTFCDVNCAIRTDVEFREQTHASHFREGKSDLFHTLMQFPSSSPADYLHCLLIGACKRLTTYVFGKTGPKVMRGHLNALCKEQIQQKLNRINEFIPAEIHHECRRLKELATYKATDFRVFLLKTAPSLLKCIADPDIYEAYLLLYAATTILCDPEECLEYNGLAKDLMKSFVQKCATLFGDQFVVSVIHRLVHLPDVVRQQGGPLDTFSAFPFESYISTIKKHIHSPHNTLQQIHNRTYEEVIVSEDYFVSKVATGLKLGGEVKGCRGSFRSVTIGDCVIKAKSLRDGFLLTGKKVVFCRKIRKQNGVIFFDCTVLSPLPALFTRPLVATKLNYFHCKNDQETSTMKLTVTVDQLERKMFCIPHDDTSYCFAPLRKFNY